MYTMLALDPGSIFTGASVLDVDEKNISIRLTELIEGKTLLRDNQFLMSLRDERFSRIHLIGNRIQQLITEHNPSVVVCEDCYYNPRTGVDNFAALTQTIHEINRTVLTSSYQIEFKLISASVIKNAMGVSGGSNDKEAMRQALIKKKLKKGAGVNLNEITDHEVDSICIGIAYLSGDHDGN